MITVLFILMQRPSEESGMGATLGGGAVTSIFGGEGINTLARITKYCVAVFFFLTFLLSMLHIAFEKGDKPQNLLEKKEIITGITVADGPQDDPQIPNEERPPEEREIVVPKWENTVEEVASSEGKNEGTGGFRE
jgi:protein translocase SecG subunit